MKHIYWFAYYNSDSPSVRYRGKHPLAYFQATKGITYDLVEPGYRPKKIGKFVSVYVRALFCKKQDSMVVIQRVNSRFLYANLLKLLVKIRPNYTVYDLDDADYLEGKSTTLYYFVKNCATVSAGSKRIVSVLQKINQNCVHTTSPVVDLGILKTKRNDLFTIGWVGGFGGGHKESLIELVFPAIKTLPFPCRLVILGVYTAEGEAEIRQFFESEKQIELVLPNTIDWHNERMLQAQIANFDVGIATLQNTELQLSKSGIKVKQYLNNGVPALCNKLPENDQLILDGENGYFCNTTEEFSEKLQKLYHMPLADYQLLSQNARASTCHFDHEKYYHDFLEVYQLSSEKK